MKHQTGRGIVFSARFLLLRRKRPVLDTKTLNPFQKRRGMDEKSRRNMLILDPERDNAELFARALETHTPGWKCYWVQSADNARSLIAEIAFSCVLADLGLLRNDHFMLIEAIRKMGRPMTVIVNAYLSEKDKLKEAANKGASRCFIKPIMVNSLRKLIDETLAFDRTDPT
ncbi:MAG: response regulator [Desulfobacteraceae bacterium]|nr:response regulator [Desulfobacteraceae bacterium]